MTTESYCSVCTVNGTLQAAVVQSTLEKAGVPVYLKVVPTGAYLDVCVPEQFVFDASNLLGSQPGMTEIAPVQD